MQAGAASQVLLLVGQLGQLQLGLLLFNSLLESLFVSLRGGLPRAGSASGLELADRGWSLGCGHFIVVVISYINL